MHPPVGPMFSPFNAFLEATVQTRKLGSRNRWDHGGPKWPPSRSAELLGGQEPPLHDTKSDLYAPAVRPVLPTASGEEAPGGFPEQLRQIQQQLHQQQVQLEEQLQLQRQLQHRWPSPFTNATGPAGKSSNSPAPKRLGSLPGSKTQPQIAKPEASGVFPATVEGQSTQSSGRAGMPPSDCRKAEQAAPKWRRLYRVTTRGLGIRAGPDVNCPRTGAVLKRGAVFEASVVAPGADGRIYLKLSGWMLLKHLPPKKGGKVTLHHLDAPLVLQKTLREQGIVGKAATLSCTYIPTDVYAAWCSIRKQGSPLPEAEFDLEGVTQLAGITTTKHLHHLPDSLESLTFHCGFNESLEGVSLPNNLQSLTLGSFNRSMRGVNLPSNLKSLDFGNHFDQSLEGVTLPSSLQSLTFGNAFNQSLEGVTLPCSLESLTLGDWFNQNVEKVSLPSSLQSLNLGGYFNQSLRRVILPSSLESLTLGKLNCVILPTNLQRLTLGMSFNLKHFTLPPSLQSLTLGKDFNESLEQLTLPSSLKSLRFGYHFDKSLEGVTLPNNLENLTFGASFNQSLEGVTLPSSLQSLTFGDDFNQSLQRVTLPRSLQSLTFGCSFDQSLEGVTLPCSLQSLMSGNGFNQSLQRVTLPSSLQTLILGDKFQRSLQRTVLPSNLKSLTFGGSFDQRLEDVILPNSLESLTFGWSFNRKLERVNLPSSLLSLTFGRKFNQSLNQVTLPSRLQSLTFGRNFNQSLNQVTLPSSLKSLTFSKKFSQSMERVTLPGSLETFSHGLLLVSIVRGWAFDDSAVDPMDPSVEALTEQEVLEILTSSQTTSTGAQSWSHLGPQMEPSTLDPLVLPRRTEAERKPRGDGWSTPSGTPEADGWFLPPHRSSASPDEVLHPSISHEFREAMGLRPGGPGPHLTRQL
eukprot:s689_g42.t3